MATPRGLLFDVDGVFFVGNEPVPGGDTTISWAMDQGIPFLFVTNTTSHPRSFLADKLRSFGIPARPELIWTPLVAASEYLIGRGLGPVAAFVPSETLPDLRGVMLLPAGMESGASAVVVGDLGEGWTFRELNRAFRLLMAAPPPVLLSLGMTRYWRDADGLTLDSGPLTKALEFASGIEAVITGKPSTTYFDAAVGRLGIPAAEVVMVGDDILGDVDGAQQAGLQGVLVRTGKYADTDLVHPVTPTEVLNSIADLPAWWRELG